MTFTLEYMVSSLVGITVLSVSNALPSVSVDVPTVANVVPTSSDQLPTVANVVPTPSDLLPTLRMISPHLQIMSPHQAWSPHCAGRDPLCFI